MPSWRERVSNEGRIITPPQKTFSLAKVLRGETVHGKYLPWGDFSPFSVIR